MSRPVCGACGELDVTSDPCRCHSPAAPLEKAVAEAREALAQSSNHNCSNMDCDKPRSCFGLCEEALRSLLAALDADRGEAEAVLRRIEAQETAVDGLRPELYGHAVAIARRYFARREGEKGGEK